MSDEFLAFIARSAVVCGVTRNEFVVQARKAAANEPVNDRAVIVLDDKAWDAFQMGDGSEEVVDESADAGGSVEAFLEADEEDPAGLKAAEILRNSWGARDR